MKIAILSDIHGNLEAFEAVLEDVDKKGVKAIYCCGDVVGYGANPCEVIELLRKRNITCVQGNHDRAILNIQEQSGFGRDAQTVLDWTRKQLGTENFLAGLPLVLEQENIVFAHANVVSPEKFSYLDYRGERLTPGFIDGNFLGENLRRIKAGQTLFIGHTHVPFKISVDGKTICNVGSVGQQRNGDRRAGYYLFDEKNLEPVRVEYDIKTAARKIKEAGLPGYLGDRLSFGL